MVELTRRGFLGACLAMGAAPAIVRADSMMRIVRPTQGLILPLAMTGAVREIRMYDVRSDSFVTRWDVFGRVDGAPTQLHVAMSEGNSGGPTYISDPKRGAIIAAIGVRRAGDLAGKNFEADRRELALTALRKEIDRTGLQIEHGVLELPMGVHHARFING